MCTTSRRTEIAEVQVANYHKYVTLLFKNSRPADLQLQINVKMWRVLQIIKPFSCLVKSTEAGADYHFFVQKVNFKINK